jgi:hypothetical protein
VRSVGNGTWTVYLKADGPANLTDAEHFDLLATGYFGGSVVHVGSGRRPVSVVVEVDAPTEEAAFEVVVSKMRAALGPDWTIEADPG